MKLKINKACDLNSISVLPPSQSRRPNVIGSGTESSMFSKASQFRSQQQSQQSFSQPMSSQFSQSSLDEILTNDQRFGSQERETSAKRISCLAPVTYAREENQMQMSRSSNNLTHRWSSAATQDHRCQVSEELEHRIRLMETSLNKFGMILDSVQSDVIQVNKAIKEVSLETEGINKKLMVHDGPLQLMLKGQDELKASLEGNLKSIPDQVRKDLHQYKLEETVLTIVALPEQIEARLLKMQSELCGSFAKEMEAIASSLKSPTQKDLGPTLLPQAIASSLKSPKQKGLEPTLLPQPIVSTIKSPNKKNQGPKHLPQRRGFHLQSQGEKLPVPEKSIVPINTHKRRAPNSKIETETQGWINPKSACVRHREYDINYKQEEIPFTEQDRQWRIIIDSDEESDGGFYCLLAEKESGMGSNLLEEIKGETERILRKARKRKRKHCNAIPIN